MLIFAAALPVTSFGPGRAAPKGWLAMVCPPARGRAQSLSQCKVCARSVTKKTAGDPRSKWRPIGNDWYCCAPGKCSVAYKNAARQGPKAAPALPPLGSASPRGCCERQASFDQRPLATSALAQPRDESEPKGVVTDAELDAILQPIYDEMDFDAFLTELYSELDGTLQPIYDKMDFDEFLAELYSELP